MPPELRGELGDTGQVARHDLIVRDQVELLRRQRRGFGLQHGGEYAAQRLLLRVLRPVEEERLDESGKLFSDGDGLGQGRGLERLTGNAEGTGFEPVSGFPRAGFQDRCNSRSASPPGTAGS